MVINLQAVPPQDGNQFKEKNSFKVRTKLAFEYQLEPQVSFHYGYVQLQEFFDSVNIK